MCSVTPPSVYISHFKTAANNLAFIDFPEELELLLYSSILISFNFTLSFTQHYFYYKNVDFLDEDLLKVICR